jgi:hypothetical protein
VIEGIIDRRILVNYRADPAVMADALPPPFKPAVVRGYAIGGICLIRLKGIRAGLLPIPWGMRSENAAHRIAVHWEHDGQILQGVYIPRRDTDSRLTRYLGGTVFPGKHYHASFTVQETAEHFSVSVQSDDGVTRVHVSGRVTTSLPAGSVFSSLAEASAFLQAGSLGYSATTTNGHYDGLELRCKSWCVVPLEVEEVASSYFEDGMRFPKGSATFDSALLMRDIQHQWHARKELRCVAGGGFRLAEATVAVGGP